LGCGLGHGSTVTKRRAVRHISASKEAQPCSS
jgi:hypothetical protein